MPPKLIFRESQAFKSLMKMCIGLCLVAVWFLVPFLFDRDIFHGTYIGTGVYISIGLSLGYLMVSVWGVIQSIWSFVEKEGFWVKYLTLVVNLIPLIALLVLLFIIIVRS